MGRGSSSIREHERNNSRPSSDWGVARQPQRVRAINSTLPRSRQHQGDERDSVLSPKERSPLKTSRA